MEKSIVYVNMLDESNCGYSVIDKDGKSVIIIFKDLECIIFDYELFKKDNFDYNYLLLKHYNDADKTYKDFMKLIGKMCKKSIDSKYFSNHINEDNRIIFYDDNNEVMVSEKLDGSYEKRKEELELFIIQNKAKFII